MFHKMSKFHVWSSRASALIGFGCFIVGIVGDAINTVPGLEPTHWLIMTAAAWVVACWHVLIGLAKAIKEK